MKLLIDYSVLAHICWHKMASPDYEARTDIEQAEFARNLAATIMYYIERFKPEETLFALDGAKYWRYETFDKYYAKHTRVFLEKRVVPLKEDSSKDSIDPITQLVYYLQYDKKTYQLVWHDGAEKYIRTKMKKAEVADMNVGIHKKVVTELKREDVPYKIMDMFPKYKGNRKESKWDYTTTREEFKLMCVNIAKNLAHTFKARILQTESAEADDIAYLYHQQHSAETMIFVTTDSDWHQMLRKGLFLKFYDPRTMDWVEKTSEQADIGLAIKIISGDSSDGIAGLCPTEGAALIGAKNAEAMVLEHGVPAVYKHLHTIMPEDMLKRNLQLIYLENCPRKVKEEIAEALKKSATTAKDAHKPGDYGMNKKDILGVQASAEEARASDLEEGIYDE